jgi:DNA ligase-1
MKIYIKFFTKNFCTKAEIKQEIYFHSICRVFSQLEKESRFHGKKNIYNSYLLPIVKETNIQTENKEDSFKKIAQIIKCSIPFLNFIQQKIPFRDKAKPNEENIRNLYTYDLIVRNYIKERFVLTSEQINKDYVRFGDLAKYLLSLISTEDFIETKPILTIEEVVNYKEKMNKIIGEKSSSEKLEIFSELIGKCKSRIEVYYVTRIFTNRLKIGIAEKNIVKIILEYQTHFSKKEDFENLISYLEKNVFGYQIYYPMILEPMNGEDGLDFSSTLKPGKFVDLQLGRPGMDLKLFIETIQRSAQSIFVETKYDGERSQIHYDGKQILMGSRSLQDQTPLYEKLKSQIFDEIEIHNQQGNFQKIRNFILDGEIVSYNVKTKTFSNFQELRKKENIIDSKEFQYYFIVFDVLYLNNRNIYDSPLEVRKKILIKTIYSKFNKILVEPGKIISLEKSKNAFNIIANYFKEAKAINCEGLVTKEIGKDSSYQFGKRRWYKIKTLNEESQDTLDLIPIAGFIGKGKTVMYSFLMASYDKKSNKYYSVCKLGTGFDKNDIDEIQNRLIKYMVPEVPENYVVPNNVRPRYFFKPQEVWEVGFDSITQSINYPSFSIENERFKGISLRFPRLVRFRFDKTVDQANTVDEILNFYNISSNNSNNI